MITTAGKKWWASLLGSAKNGYTGTAASFTATTLKASGSPGWTVNAFTGQDVYVGAVVGTILSNTAEVLTVARWENPGSTRGGAAGTTPGGTPAFTIASGQSQAAWIALTANAGAPAEGDTTLTGEIKTAGGGLVRALASFTYIGTNKYEIKGTYTANGSDVLPVTIAKIGVFNAQSEGILVWETLLSATAELKSSGDIIIITDTVTGT